jgi:hypothetical protein
MKKKTYVSIDMDFWNYGKVNDAELYLRKIFRMARRKKIPIHAVTNHQQLTDLVSATDTNELINLDDHSDLAGKDVTRYNCGTWVSYVKQRKKMVYKWVHRHSSGDCNWDFPLFGKKRCKTKYTEYKLIKHKIVKQAPSPNVLLKTCKAIGFCLSPSYTETNLQYVFHELVDEFELPMTKGTKWEFGHGVKRKPK